MQRKGFRLGPRTGATLIACFGMSPALGVGISSFAARWVPTT